MKASDMAIADLARRSGVSDRMIKYILAKERIPSIEIADSLAQPFGLSGWQLLKPNLNIRLAQEGKLDRLLDNYSGLSDTARDYIDEVAERETTYTSKIAK